MKIQGSPFSRIILPVCLLLLFILALIWVSYFRQRAFERKDAIHFAIQRNSNLAVALEQFTAQSLQNADAILQMIRMEYSDQDAVNLRELVRNNSQGREFMEGLTIVDRNGRVKMTNVNYPADAIPNFLNNPSFIFHSKSIKDSLLISKLPVAAYTGEMMVLSRSLFDQEGKFGGMVTLQLRPSTFTSVYTEARLFPNDVVYLLVPGDTTYPGVEDARKNIGTNKLESLPFSNVGKNTDGFYHAGNAMNGQAAWFSYHKLKNYPVISMVGSPEAEILAEYRERWSSYVTPRVIVSLLLALFSFLCARFLLQRRKLAEQHLQEKEQYQRLMTEQMIAVQERERECIGRDLHDNVGQVLTTVKLYLDTVSKQIDNPLVFRSIDLVNSSITEIRNLSHQLAAPTLGTGSLIDSMEALVENVSLSANIKIEFDHKGYSTCIIMSQKLALYRVLQEQLNNIVKHAKATRVAISLHQSNNNVILIVKDNGKGFDPAIKTGGLGINNIISRARVFGGLVSLETNPGEGCALKVTIPYTSSGTEAEFDKQNLSVA